MSQRISESQQDTTESKPHGREAASKECRHELATAGFPPMWSPSAYLQGCGRACLEDRGRETGFSYTGAKLRPERSLPRTPPHVYGSDHAQIIEMPARATRILAATLRFPFVLPATLCFQPPLELARQSSENTEDPRAPRPVYASNRGQPMGKVTAHRAMRHRKTLICTRERFTRMQRDEPFTALAMAPPQLVMKWAREMLPDGARRSSVCHRRRAKRRGVQWSHRRQ